MVWPAVRLRPREGASHRRLVHEGDVERDPGHHPGGGGPRPAHGHVPLHGAVLRRDEPPVAARHPDRGPHGRALHPALHRRAPATGSWVPAVSPVHAPARLPDHRAREPQGVAARPARGRAAPSRTASSSSRKATVRATARSRPSTPRGWRSCSASAPLPVYVRGHGRVLEGPALRRLPLQHRPHRRTRRRCWARSHPPADRRIRGVPAGAARRDGRAPAAAARRRGCGRLRRCGPPWPRACARRCRVPTRPRSRARWSRRAARPCARVVFFGSRKTKARPDAYSGYDLFVVVSAYTPFYRSLRDQGRLRHRPALGAALNAWLPPNQVSVRGDARGRVARAREVRGGQRDRAAAGDLPDAPRPLHGRPALPADGAPLRRAVRPPRRPRSTRSSPPTPSPTTGCGPGCPRASTSPTIAARCCASPSPGRSARSRRGARRRSGARRRTTCGRSTASCSRRCRRAASCVTPEPGRLRPGPSGHRRSRACAAGSTSGGRSCARRRAGRSTS